MLLTDAERKLFAEWLRQDAASSRILANQLTRPGSWNTTADAMIALWRREADAQDIVAAKLEKTESATIG